MAEVRKNLTKKHPDRVSISADGWYPTRQNQKTPFQASNQLVYSVAENDTPDKKNYDDYYRKQNMFQKNFRQKTELSRKAHHHGALAFKPHRHSSMLEK